MTPTMRTAGTPSPIASGTHVATDLPAPIPFDPAVAGSPEVVDATDPIGLDGVGLSPGIVDAARLIRPLCVGALMAIPTVGTASVGIVAALSPARAMAMAEASTRFLAGIPGDIVALIGFLAGGYGLAKTIEKRLGGDRS